MSAIIAFGLALALAPTSTPQDRPLTVETLTYFETYSCAALGVLGEEYALEQLGDAAKEPQYQTMFTGLRRLSEMAAGALTAAQNREGLTAAQVEEAESTVLDDLAAMEDETVFALLDVCGDIFGVLPD